ncbi:hypothetical protein G9F72_014695 [Clostridium estertheticum]|nr:hypothetical protein [Clostridium estertheticum]MBZ9687577.1 hypothetical protein [Clostridium estertheticum]
MLKLNDIIKEFLLDCEVKNYSKRTIQSYRNCNALFQNYLKQEMKIENFA